ncbi:DUF5105 domain-containing protein [Selenomonas sputigena]|uniref:DUF5105 domain-containing protein n=1 Tax=Selenomonas sputigena TaxID=69823 RepID=A0ABV3X488_9FIRM
MKRKMMSARRLLLPFVAILAMFLVAGCGDKPKDTADKAVLAYAELYAYGDTDKTEATGMTKEQKEKISEALLTEVDQMFQSMMLSENNAVAVTNYYVADRKANMNLKAKVKKDDSENPVVELTATPVDKAELDKLLQTNEDLLALGVVLGMAQQQGVDVRNDASYQQGAMDVLRKFIDEIPYDEEKTLDVPCQLVKSDDGKTLHWAPKDPKAIQKFLDGEK